MPRRRRSRASQPSNLEVLLTLPWWGRGLLGIAVFAGLRMVAASLSASPFTRALAPMLTALGNLALLFFGAAALIGLIGQVLDQRRWAPSKIGRGTAGAPIRREPFLHREASKPDEVWLSTQPLPVHTEESTDVSPVASAPPPLFVAQSDPPPTQSPPAARPLVLRFGRGSRPLRSSDAVVKPSAWSLTLNRSPGEGS